MELDSAIESVLVNSGEITFAVIAFMLILLLLGFVLITWRLVTTFSHQSIAVYRDRNQERESQKYVVNQQLDALRSEIAKGQVVAEAFRQLSETNSGVIENLAHIREQFERMSTDSKQLTAAFYEFVPPLKQDLMQFRIEAIERISRIPTQDALILVSTDGYVLAASSSLIDVLGVSPQTVVGLPFDWLIYDPRSITSGESFHKHYLIETVVKTQQIVPNYVMGLYHQQYGKHVWVRVSCEPYFNYTPHGREMIGVLVLLHAESDFVVSEERGSDV